RRLRRVRARRARGRGRVRRPARSRRGRRDRPRPHRSRGRPPGVAREAARRREGLGDAPARPRRRARSARQPRRGGGARRGRVRRLERVRAALVWDDGSMTGQTRLAILGATGSIGRQALEVVAAHPDRLRVTALSATSRADELREIAGGLRVAATVIGRGERGELDALVSRDDVDLVLVASPGIAGLRPTLAALRAGKAVALANKEVLVAGGHLVRALAGGAGERLRPVDSEHSGLWQALAGERLADVRRVVLTASGGPFRDRPLADLARVTPEEALRHPTWRMGPKVTVDSATLANKGYEVVETHWLYGLPYERIDVIGHPESIVHALVEFVDGSVKAQLGAP